MGDRSAIEWTDSSWNPATGCTEVSTGCDRCYAKTLAERFRGTPGHYYEAGFDVTLRPQQLDQPLRWRRPRYVFLGSMFDLFHQDIPDEYIARMFGIMALAKRHTFLGLTKRHGRMHSLLTSPRWRGMCEDAQMRVAAEAHEAGALSRQNFEACRDAWWSDFARPLPNFWLGVSVEDQQRAGLRIPALLDTPVARRILSCEPLLSALDLSPWTAPIRGVADCVGDQHDAGHECSRCARLDWVIVGGESGHGARPMHPDWVRSLRDQCAQSSIPFFFKQWGRWQPTTADRPGAIGMTVDGMFGSVLVDGQWTIGDGTRYTPMVAVGKGAAGRALDGRTHDDRPAPMGVAGG